MSSKPIFEVEEPSESLAFQDFSSRTISADAPTGRISPANSPNPNPSMRASQNLYAAEQSMTNTLSGATKSGGVLNLDFYTGYFDVDTITVLTRCWKTLVPMEDYVTDVLAGVPDLYGPFWVPTTLIFSLFLTSSLSSSVHAYLAGSTYTYDFTRLGAAVTLVYTYCLGLPIVIWAVLRYWAGVDERSAVEVISLYGYSSTVWILISWAVLIPIPILRLVLALGGTGLSLAFLLRNLYPVLTKARNVAVRGAILVIGGLHLVLAMALWWGFMAGGSGAITKDPIPGSGSGLPIGGGSGEGSDLPAGDPLLRWLFS